MAEYIARKEANKWVVDWLRTDRNWHPYSKGKSIPTVEVFDILSRIPAADVVSKAAYDQVAWERNLAEEQLKSIGKSLGEKMDDVQPVKHGKNLNEEWPSLFECSICHWSCWDTYCGDTDTYNYCPNCGSKMDET